MAFFSPPQGVLTGLQQISPVTKTSGNSFFGNLGDFLTDTLDKAGDLAGSYFELQLMRDAQDYQRNSLFAQQQQEQTLANDRAAFQNQLSAQNSAWLRPAIYAGLGLIGLVIVIKVIK